MPQAVATLLRALVTAVLAIATTMDVGFAEQT